MIYYYLPSLAVQVHFQSGILHKPSVSAGGGWVTGGADVGHLLPTSAGHLPDRGVICFRSVPQFVWTPSLLVHFVKSLALFTPTSLQPSQFTPAPVYTQFGLHPPLCKPSAITTSSVYTHHCVSPVQLQPAQSTPTTV